MSTPNQFDEKEILNLLATGDLVFNNEYKSKVLANKSNYKSIYIPEVQTPFLFLVSGDLLSLVKDGIASFSYNGCWYMGLELRDDGIYLLYPEFCEVTKVIKTIISASKKYHENVTETKKKNLEQKSIAIRNYYEDYLYGLKQLEEQIFFEIKEMNDDCIEMLGPEMSDKIKVFELLHLINPEAHRFEISTYILKVFAFIEYVSILLLPFIDGRHGYEWEKIKEACTNSESENNGFIAHAWTDIIIQSRINVVSKVMPAFKVHSGTFVEQYYYAKKNLRNTLTHGEILSDKLDLLTYEVPLIKYKTRIDIFPEHNECGVHSFHRVKLVLDYFIEMLEKHYSKEVLYFKSGLAIPADVSEIIEAIRKSEDFDKYLANLQTVYGRVIEEQMDMHRYC